MGARRRSRLSFGLVPCACCLALAAGCRSSCDLVEAELRARENDLRELRADLARAECQNEALLRELHAVRQGTAAKITPEQASQTYTVKQITLGRGTGGYDEDTCPGDEALQVVLEPQDCDGHTIKAPGSLHVEALEISPEGLKSPLSDWDLPPDQLRRYWRSGFLITGYVVVLPWKNWPSTERLRVTARFTLADGRVFEADKDVTIRLTPQDHRKPAPAPYPGEAPGPLVPEPENVLPMPRKVEPSGTEQGARGPGPGAPEERGTRVLPPTGSAVAPPVPASRAWWLPPAETPPVQTTALWGPKAAPPSLADAVQLRKPVSLGREPGQDEEP